MMSLNDLETVNELAQRWRRLNALLKPGSIGTSELRVNGVDPYELSPETAAKILGQLKADVEKKLANYGVQPPTPAAADRRGSVRDVTPGAGP